MSIYKALRNSDAEITLNLETGQAIFDYSKNKFAKAFNSNTSCILNKTGVMKRDKTFTRYEPLWAFLLITGSVLLVANTKYQFEWQKFLKWFHLNRSGMLVQTNSGKLLSNQLKFHLDNNIWFEYELVGDYKAKVSKISLLRHFTTRVLDEVTYTKQDGWDVIFDFIEIPQDGICVLKST